MGPPASRVEVGGVEIRCWSRGTGPALLLIHETAATAEIWTPLAEALGEELTAIAFDRRGWGGSEAPEVYVRTTIEEQALDAAGVLGGHGAETALVCGAGIGAVIALELLLRRRDLVRGAVLIEPPLLALVPEATEGISADRKAIEEAFREGGPPAALDLYLRGGLPYLGPGAERIPPSVSAAARERPLSLFAELATVPAWSIRTAALAEVAVPSTVVVTASTPQPVRSAAEQVADRLGGSALKQLGGEGLPHVAAAPELAEELRRLLC
jgi:pimeloyl-ACP methyl ester carboxylesterase